MRDFFVNPAQTNLELYQQAIDRGYDATRRARLAQAYLFALRQVFPLARGSGKPFISHLAGTASLVLASGCDDDLVIAALLHAVYQRRVPFQAGLPPAERRALVVRAFGPEVDDLVQRYTSFEECDLDDLPADQVEGNADVLALRLADELEDLCGHALALHGPPGDSSIRGGYSWRRDAKIRQGPVLTGLAQQLGLDGIGRSLAHWLDFSSVPVGFNEMRTGWTSSVNMDMEFSE